MPAAMPSRMNCKELPMLYTIALILLILWALGLAAIALLRRRSHQSPNASNSDSE